MPKNTSVINIDKKETDSESIYQEMPCNIEAEQVLLGALLTNNEALNRIGDFIIAEHFYEPIHQRIYEAVVRFGDKGLIANPVTLKNYFDKDEALSELGGAQYLNIIAGKASGIIDIRNYGELIYSLAISRNLISIGEDMVVDAYKNTGEERSSEQIERTEQKLFQLASEGSSDANYSPLSHSIIDAIKASEAATKREGAISGVPSGFSDMDRIFGGFHNSDLIILAARPSMGKTALALNFAVKAAESLQREFSKKKDAGETDDKEPGSVGLLSLEMSSEQLATRLLSIKTGINAGNIRRGKLEKSKHKNEFEDIVKASQDLHSLPIFLDDTPAQSISAVRTRARRLKRKHNLSMLIIDYLQLLRGVSEHAKTSRVNEVSEITMGLKAIAKELNIPVIALSQLSRAVEQREDKRPQLADLRESGSIEQDADMVMFIYREAYYKERKKPVEGSEGFEQWLMEMEEVNNIAEIIVAKNRNGPIDNVTLFFDKTTTKFGNYTPENVESQF